MTDGNPPKNRHSWPLLVLATLAVLVVVALAVAGGGTYWVVRHVRSEPRALADAEQAFVRERAHLAGPPLITLSGDGRALLTPEAGAPPGPITSLHILAYDRGQGRLVRVDLPAWLLRLARRGTVHVDGLDLPGRAIERLTIADLERHGPGLVLDATTPDGARVLVWTE